jgi:hypothetical protein
VAGVASSAVELGKDIYALQDGHITKGELISNLAVNGVFTLLGAVPGMKAGKLAKRAKSATKLIDKSVDNVIDVGRKLSQNADPAAIDAAVSAYK